MNLLNKTLIFFLFIIPVSLNSQSTTWTGISNELWSNPNNWSNGVPDSTKDVVIPWLSSEVHQPVIDINTTFAKLQMNPNPNKLKINDSIIVNVLDNIKIGNDAVLDIGNGRLNVYCSVNSGGNILISNGALNFISDFNFTGGGTIINDNGTINIGNSTSTFKLAGNNTITSNNGEINIYGNVLFFGSGKLDVSNSSINVFGDVEITGSADLQLDSANFYVEGNFIATGSGVIEAGNSQFVIAGELWQVDNDATFDFDQSTIIFTNSNITLVAGGGVNVLEFYNLIIDSNSTVTSEANIIIYNDLNVDDNANLTFEDGNTINVIGDVSGENLVNTNHPYIISISYDINNNNIILVFNLALNPDSAQKASNYHLEDSDGAIVAYFESAVLKAAPNDNIVILHFEKFSKNNSSLAKKIFEPEKTYFLVANNIYSSTNSNISSNHIKLLQDGINEPSPLPITLLSFNGHQQEKTIFIEWITASETNNDYFALEKSTDNLNNWETIAKINGNGNSNKVIQYNYIDDKPADGIQYYRIKQTDYDGNFEYFNIIAVNYIFSENFEVKIFPNPAQNHIFVNAQGFNGSVKVQINDMAGNKVLDILQSGNENIKIDISNLLSGVYLINVMIGNSLQQFKLIKN